MPWCGNAAAGIAGVLRIRSEGMVQQHLESLEQLQWEHYHNQPEAISKLLIGRHVAVRNETRDERRLVCSLMSLAEHGDIQFYRSENNGSATDPRTATIPLPTYVRPIYFSRLLGWDVLGLR